MTRDEILKAYSEGERDFSEANLHGANLSGANLSGAEGLLDPIVWLTEEFGQTEEGIVCYKVFSQYFEPVEGWVMEPESVIEEIVNPCRTDECGSGVNVATSQWVKANCDKDRTVWRCLIRWPWLVGIVIPYSTDGKFRAGRVELVEETGIVEDL